MDDWKQDRIGSAERGENPTVLARMRSGFAVMGDSQFLPGYCLLLASPKVEQIGCASKELRSVRDKQKRPCKVVIRRCV